MKETAMSDEGNGKPLRYRVSYSTAVSKAINELRYQHFSRANVPKKRRRGRRNR